ncbi:hypothetical protein [Arthrobacter sp. A2-55]|uniref:hypothetical protein n=1 Tax=Arthrobacter sp. A2-55 TaxID=2897337 RepID=UPI0021CDA520|nr:hypothetical protein [Arthrobacter sp. A2-55]MCU6481293.1 hypothetical protein [Arthrobacter sp. A2-55]
MNFFEVALEVREDWHRVAHRTARVPVFEADSIPVGLRVPNTDGVYNTEPSDYLDLLFHNDTLYAPKRHYVKSRNVYVDVMAGKRHFRNTRSVDSDGWDMTAEEEADEYVDAINRHIIVDGLVLTPVAEPIFRVHLIKTNGWCPHSLIKVVEATFSTMDGCWYSMAELARARSKAHALANRTGCAECSATIVGILEPQILIPESIQALPFTARQAQMRHEVTIRTRSMIESLGKTLTRDSLDTAQSRVEHIASRMRDYDLESVGVNLIARHPDSEDIEWDDSWVPPVAKPSRRTLTVVR